MYTFTRNNAIRHGMTTFHDLTNRCLNSNIPDTNTWTIIHCYLNTCFNFFSLMIIIPILPMYFPRNSSILIYVNVSIITCEHRSENELRNSQNNYPAIWQRLIIISFNIIWLLRTITLHLVNISQTPVNTKLSLVLNKWQASRFHKHLLHQCSLH